MAEFKNLKNEIRKQFDRMASEQLFTVELDKDKMWELYLNSFPAGVNEIYIKRTEYDCSCCRHFIKNIGNIVTVDKNLNLISIWDIKTDSYYQPVVDALSSFVKKHIIHNIFLSKEEHAGTDTNKQLLQNGKVRIWDHFYVKYPNTCIYKSANETIDTVLGKRTTDYQVFSRSMKELSIDSGETILELIDSNSIYRGKEHKNLVKEFIKEKNDFDKIPSNKQSIWCWTRLNKTHVIRIRNTALGTLLINLSEGMEVDDAVRKFEAVMAPTNYKRPKTIFTKKMIEAAEKKIKELGFEDSLSRRHATIEDITINNVLFINRTAKKAIGIFDELKSDVPVNIKNFNKVEEVSIDNFIVNILPHVSTIELLMESKLQGNLMNLVAPLNKHAPSMFKWDNNFSWSYNGDLADSIKQNVKAAGGKVDGILRFSIQWNENGDNVNDFDAHCIEPNNNEIYYANKISSRTKGKLDVDIMHPAQIAVENITWPDEQFIKEGQYTFFVNNYSHRGGTSGFRAEVECNGELHQYSYDKDIKIKESVTVAIMEYTKKGGFKFVKELDSTISSKEIWGIKTGNFIKVTSLMMSPNYWDGQSGKGNKHFFFILEDCKTEVSPRGFFNEYLRDDLMAHRNIFEALGSKMKVDIAKNGLSGLGFSSTQKNSVTLKVSGNTSRIIKINF